MQPTTISTSGTGYAPTSQTPPSTQASRHAITLPHGLHGVTTYHPTTAMASHAPTMQMQAAAANANPQASFSLPQLPDPPLADTLQLRLLMGSRQYGIPASITTARSNVADPIDTKAFLEELHQVERCLKPQTLQRVDLGGGQTLVQVQYVLSSAPYTVATLQLTPDNLLRTATIASTVMGIETWRQVAFDVGSTAPIPAASSAAASTSGIVSSHRARTPPAVNDPRPPQRARIGAGTTTTSASLPSGTTGSSTPAAVSTFWRRRVGLDRLETARDTAFQQLVAALPIPSQLSHLPLATANFTLIKREDFTRDEDARWRRLYPGAPQAERDNSRYYRITMPESSIMINETPPTTSLIQDWQKQGKAVTDTKAAIAFFDRLGTMPTPEVLHDGANYFHLDRNAWRAAQPPHTNPVDTDVSVRKSPC